MLIWLSVQAVPPGLSFDDINIQFHMDEPDDDDIDEDGLNRGIVSFNRCSTVVLMFVDSVAQLLSILAPTGLPRALRHPGWRGGIDDDYGDDDFGIFSFRKRRHGASDEPPKVPSDAGTELMGTGDFGSNSHYVDELRKRKKTMATKLMWRELGLDTAGKQRPTRSISQVS